MKFNQLPYSIDYLRTQIYLFHSLVHWPPRKKKIINVLEKILKQYPEEKFRIVDIGSGPGLLAKEIQGKGVDYLGIDNNPQIIKYCNKLFGDLPEFLFIDINITDSAFQFEKNDIIILSGAVHHLNDTILSELLKKALDGFALIISDHAREGSMKNHFIPSILQRLDRGKFIRPYRYFENLKGYKLDHSVKFPCKVAGIVLWTFFCHVYRPKNETFYNQSPAK